MKKTLLLSLGFLLSSWICSAQNPIISPYNNFLIGQLPPYYDQDRGITSPQAWGFMKYRGETPNLYTGTVSATIPVYTYEDSDFTIPITLNYASNGYIPNVQASDVGLGWTHNAGGYITRIIRGVPDEGLGGQTRVKGFAHLEQEDYTNLNFIPGIPGDNYVDIVYFGGVQSERAMAVHVTASGYVEMEPDIYHFNFMGHTGSFMRAGKKIYVFDTNHPHGEYSIETLTSDQDIIIKTGDGYMYTFSVSSYHDGIMDVKTHSLDGTFVSSSNINYGGYYPEQWVLSKITAPNGREVILTYLDDITNTTTNVRPGGSNSQTIFIAEDESTSVVQQVDYNFIEYTSQVPQIKSIEIEDYVKIQFDYLAREQTERFQIGIGNSAELAHELMRLCKITVSKRSNVATNPDIPLKTCVLTHIYANNTEGNPVMLLDNVDISGEGTYKMSYYGLNEVFPYHGTLNVDHWGYNCGEPVYGFANTSNYFFPSWSMISWYIDWLKLQQLSWRRPNANYAKIGMLSQLTYPTGGYTTFEYENHTYRSYVDKDKTERYALKLFTASQDYNAGGLRIKKITDHPINRPAITREYVYETSPGVSSGILLEHPYYYSERSIQPYYFVGDDPVASFTYYSTKTLSTGELSGYRTDRTHIEYEKVKEIYNDGSYTVYDYANYRIAPDEFRSSSLTDIYPNKYCTAWGTDGVMQMTQAEQYVFFSDPNFEPQYRGKLLATTLYNSAGHKVKETINEYDTSKERRWIQSWIQTVAGFYLHRSYVESYPLLSTTEKIYSGEEENPTKPIFSNKYSYLYNNLGQLTNTQYVESDGTTTNERTIYVSDIDPASQTDIQKAMIARNILDRPIKTLSTIIDRGSSDPDRPTPDLELRTAEEQYEYTMVGDSVICLASHKIAEITDPQLLSVVPAYYDKAVYNQYNANGRVLQMTDQTGLSTCYVWGYRGYYIIAKIIGADYSEVKKALGPFPIVMDGLTSTQENALRNIPGALVTTYRHDPFVGITEIKDPSGRVKSFTYDDYGRLTEERDDNGDLVQRYTYSIATE